MTEGRSQTFRDPNTAASPLARELLGIAGVQQVFFLNDFITVTRQEGVEWDVMAPQLEAVIRKHLEAADPGHG